MKKIVCFLLFCGLVLTGFSQDLIVTTDNDSIHARITEIKKSTIYFDIVEKGVLYSGSMPIERVQVYKYNYFNREQTPFPDAVKKESTVDTSTMNRLEIKLQGGYSYLFQGLFPGELPSNMEEYNRKLQSGINVGGVINYHIVENLGVGLKVSYFMRSRKTDNLNYLDSLSGYEYLNRNDKIKILYIGPNIVGRWVSYNKKHILSLNASIGYLHFRDDFSVTIKGDERGNIPTYMKGGNVGGAIDLGYNFKVAKNFYLGVQAGVCIGRLSKNNMKGTIQYHGYEEMIKLNRFDAGVSIMYFP